LSQNSVWSLLQDRQGVIWISTTDGLNKFDGHTFKNYRNSVKDKSTISCNTNALIFEDSEGKIWLTHQKGVSIYYPKADTFNNLIKRNLNPEKPNPILGFDSEHRVWIWFNGIGLSCYTSDGKEVLKEQLRSVNLKLGKMQITSGKIMPNNYLYIGGLEGVISLNISNLGFYLNTYIRDIYSSAIFNKSTILWGSSGRVYSHSINTNTFHVTELFNPGYLVTFFNKTKKGDFLIGSRYSSVMYTFVDHKQIPQKDFTYRVNGDSLFHYECCFIDRTGHLWLGTNFEGLLRVNAPTKKLRHYANDQNKNLTKAIIKDQFDNLYISNYEYGIDIYDKSGLKLTTITQTKTTLAFSDLNNTYILGYDVGQGIYLLNKKTFKLSYLSGLSGTLKSFPSISSHGKFRYFILDNFVSRFSENENKVDFKKLFKVKPEATGSILVNKKKDVLVAYIGFIEIYDSQNILRKTIEMPNAGTVKCMHINKNKEYLIGTSAGLYIYDRYWKLLGGYNESNGLPNAFIYGVLEDKEGNLWLSHNKGISKLNTKKGVLLNISKDDGLQSNEFNTGAYYLGNNYELFFGGLRGVNSFFSSEIKKNTIEAEGILSQLYVNDKPFPAKDNLVLNYEENTVAFEFSSNEYTNPEKNEFQYMLEGVDKTWIISNNKRFARYANLPFGKFTFILKCSNNDGVWSTKTYRFSFTILAPFYKRNWFYILCILLSITIIGFIFYIYNKRKFEIQKQKFVTERQLQKQRERFSRDLHDNIGSRTSLLLNNLEVLKSESNDQNMELLEKNATDILQNLRETVWAMNKGSITIESLADKITQFIHLRWPVNSATKLNIKQNIWSDYQIPAEDFLNFYRITQEAVNNSMKYSHAPNLYIEIDFLQTKILKIVIYDDGIGFTSNSDIRDNFGLNNMRARAEESKIELDIQSTNGTKITLHKQY